MFWTAIHKARARKEEGSRSPQKGVIAATIWGNFRATFPYRREVGFPPPFDVCDGSYLVWGERRPSVSPPAKDYPESIHCSLVRLIWAGNPKLAKLTNWTCWQKEGGGGGRRWKKWRGRGGKMAEGEGQETNKSGRKIKKRKNQRILEKWIRWRGFLSILFYAALAF